MTGLYKFLFLIADFILLNLSILTAFYIFESDFFYLDKTGIVHLVLYSNLAWVFLIIVASPYSMSKSWKASKILKNQLAFIFIHLIVVLSLVVFLNRAYSLSSIALIYLLFLPLFFLVRIVMYYVRKIVTDPPSKRNFLIIGINDISFEVRKFYLLHPELNYRFIAYVEYEAAGFPLSKVQTICATSDVHEIYCCLPNVSSGQLRDLVSFGLDSLIKVKIVLDTKESDRLSIQLDRYNKQPGKNTIALDESWNQLMKRVFDLCFASIFILLVMSWLTPLLAIIIRFDSRGPVFFLQNRSGRDNVSFKCMKFRTMVVNTEADTKQATSNDPRITKLGAFLRKTSLDELPQFFNVFLGDMSVVGPRPHMLRHTDEYSKLIESFMGRHYVKPGVTGLAQCLGYRGETKTLVEMENRVRLDRYYIENWTFWLDIKIIFLTVISLIRGSDKAY